MKQVIMFTGKTGAGKSTLCKNLEDYYHYPLLSFKKMGKEFANVNGYNRIRECYAHMEIKEFRFKISEHIFRIIKEQLDTDNVVLIDGLYTYDVLEKLKKNYDCKLIYLKTEDSIRYDRLSKRLSITIKQAQEESKIKEHLNNDLGAEEVMALADYVVDGAKSIDEIFEATKQYIEK